MARTGTTAAPAPVTSLPTAANFPWQVATSPAGGWVVTYPTAAASPDLEQPSRLATVNPAGAERPFGPAFDRNKSVISMAVSPDGSRLAIVVVTTFGTARRPSRSCRCPGSTPARGPGHSRLPARTGRRICPGRQAGKTSPTRPASRPGPGSAGTRQRWTRRRPVMSPRWFRAGPTLRVRNVIRTLAPGSVTPGASPP
jgi:hypothetical protein